MIFVFRFRRKKRQQKSDDETVIMDEDDWNNLKSDITFKEYLVILM